LVFTPEILDDSPLNGRVGCLLLSVLVLLSKRLYLADIDWFLGQFRFYSINFLIEVSKQTVRQAGVFDKAGKSKQPL